MSDWTDELHTLLLSISGAMNDPNVDTEFLGRAGVELERELFPLLSWIGESVPMGTVELADMVGHDHSTVSRQVAKLVEANLVTRIATPDKRLRLLLPTKDGRALLAKLAKIRRTMIEEHFQDWSTEDRRLLLALLSRALKAIRSLFPNRPHTEERTRRVQATKSARTNRYHIAAGMRSRRGSRALT
jgi:DNA-binding MarR family transcriptional regulator